jgi:hypothetical protein
LTFGWGVEFLAIAARGITRPGATRIVDSTRLRTYESAGVLVARHIGTVLARRQFLVNDPGTVDLFRDTREVAIKIFPYVSIVQ